MSSSFYDRMDKKLYPLTPSSLAMINANGERMKVIGCAQIPIEFDGCIGKPELWNFHVIMNLTDNILMGKDDIEEVTLKNGMVIKKDANIVRMSEAVTIPGQTTCMIKVISAEAASEDQDLRTY